MNGLTFSSTGRCISPELDLAKVLEVVKIVLTEHDSSYDGNMYRDNQPNSWVYYFSGEKLEARYDAANFELTFTSLTLGNLPLPFWEALWSRVKF